MQDWFFVIPVKVWSLFDLILLWISPCSTPIMQPNCSSSDLSTLLLEVGRRVVLTLYTELIDDWSDLTCTLAGGVAHSTYYGWVGIWKCTYFCPITPVLWLISYMVLVCVVEVLYLAKWHVSKTCTIPRSLQTLCLFLQDHSVKLKGVCATTHMTVNPNTTSDEVICCAVFV